MKHRAFEVFIRGHSNRLPEFDVKLEDPHTMTCFIPSEAGQSFSVCFESSFEEASASVRCLIDGRKMGASLCRARNHGRRWGVRVAPDLRAPFVFSELSFTEEEDVMVNETILQNLGCIEVSVYRVKRHGIQRAGFKSDDVKAIGAINEKSKKAGSHCVSLGASQACHNHARTDSIPFIPGEGCWAKFRFRYRPRAILQAQGIIPAGQANEALQPQAGPSNRPHRPNPGVARTPQANPSSRKRRLSTALLSPEVDAKPRLGRQAEDGNSPTRQAHPPSSERPAKRVKKETKPNPPLLSHEIIDLTQSEDVKRERSPIRLPEHHIGAVIDLTLDD